MEKIKEKLPGLKMATPLFLFADFYYYRYINDLLEYFPVIAVKIFLKEMKLIEKKEAGDKCRK